jgi:hypothetical protein
LVSIRAVMITLVLQRHPEVTECEIDLGNERAVASAHHEINLWAWKPGTGKTPADARLGT